MVSTGQLIGEQPFEIVERKGKLHPDTISDQVMNSISLSLCKEYIKEVGKIQHYNVDKCLLVAGGVDHAFGGGKMTKKMEMYFGDRATAKVGNKEIPIHEIAKNTAKKWFLKNSRFIKPDEHMEFYSKLQPGSVELTDIFNRKKIGANDTSASVGYAPYSETELVALNLEQWLNSKDFKAAHPESGEDVKVMCIRNKRDLDITVAMGLNEREIENENQYFEKKAELLEAMNDCVETNYNGHFKISFNTLDQKGRGVHGTYLTLLGTSAEDGDCGQVGRGNRVNGVISLCRPCTSEAAAGKNPVSHIGNIYNHLTFKMANRIVKETNAEEAYVWLVSKIGRPIDEPRTFIKLVKGDDEKKAKDIVADELEHINKFVDDLSKGKYQQP